MKKIFYFLAAVMLFTSCCNKSSENPFFVEWDTPYGIPPFEQIQNEHYVPAFEEGIRQQQAEILEIVNNPDAPTFENTLVALDQSGALLGKVSGVFFNLSSSDNSKAFDAIQEQVLPILSEHSDNIYMDPLLFERVKAVYNDRENLELTEEQMTLLDKVYQEFVRNGIALNEADQARMREINKELSMLQQKFGNNLLAETNAFQLVLETEDELAGLPEGVRQAGADLAKSAGMEGKYLYTLPKPSYIPFMQYSARRDLREQMYKAMANRGNNNNENDNKEIVKEITRLRIEKANLLGYKTSSAFILDNKMAKTPETVNAFLAEIFVPANEKAKEELAEMQAISNREGNDFTLAAWDWDYYAEKLRQEKYALNENELKPYFKMENVREGIFYLANRLWGLNFKPLSGMPLYNPGVEVFEVTDGDGSLIGIFTTDYYPRESKRAGAWMSNFREQRIVDGEDVRPIVLNIGNFTAPTSTTPSLLTMDEVETMFHEFGHGLHGLLAKSNYVTVSGTNVARDFVELPSQIMENWAFEPEMLAVYAKHYETGEVIPDSLVEKINGAAFFNQGFRTAELSAAAILDMNWHDLTSVEGIDPIQFEADKMNEIGLIEQIIPRYRTTYFNHIWAGGYSAGYYSYLWAEVLDKDAYQYFVEQGIFDPVTAGKFRVLLEKGGSVEPMKLYKEFRGQEPNSEYLLKGRGLK